MTSPTPSLAAIVPAGGRARRFGADKTLASVGGSTLVARAVAACRTAGADPIVVVGPAATAPTGVVSVREEPPFGGPVAALAAGLGALSLRHAGLADAGLADAGLADAGLDAALLGGKGLIAVVAADMPFADTALTALIAAAVAHPSRDGAWAIDDDGRHQPLLAVYRVGSLRRALGDLEAVDGAPMRAITATLDLAEVPVGTAAIDIDTPEDLARAGGEQP